MDGNWKQLMFYASWNKPRITVCHLCRLLHKWHFYEHDAECQTCPEGWPAIQTGWSHSHIPVYLLTNFSPLLKSKHKHEHNNFRCRREMIMYKSRRIMFLFRARPIQSAKSWTTRVVCSGEILRVSLPAIWAIRRLRGRPVARVLGCRPLQTIDAVSLALRAPFRRRRVFLAYRSPCTTPTITSPCSRSCRYTSRLLLAMVMLRYISTVVKRPAPPLYSDDTLASFLAPVAGTSLALDLHSLTNDLCRI